MNLSVATNFDDNLIDAIKDYPVNTLYGKLSIDFFGGGRSSYMLSQISKKKLIKHIKHAKNNGIGFNYLLNASCFGNVETTKKGQYELRKMLDWLSQMEVSALTISNPLLLRVIKSKYPHFKVRISVFAGVDHIQKAKYWENLGADTICLDSLTVNRDYQALKSLAKGIGCDLELLANGNCLASCAMSPTHMNMLSHSSQKNDPNKRFVLDHCILDCSKMKLENPVNFLRSDWIRPEDLYLYEELGYKNFKLVERGLSTEIMVKRVKAYSERVYDGNLIDLIQPYGHTSNDKQKSKGNAFSSLRKLLHFFRPMKININKLLKIKKLTERRGMLCDLKIDQPIFIDNKALNGFLENIWAKKCRYKDCNTCGYCEEVTGKVITLNNDFRDECKKLYKEIDDDINSGSMWL